MAGTTARLGVRVLELPELRGISLDNYECKLEKRSMNMCSKINRMESTKLANALRVNEKTKDIFEHNLRMSEEAFAKKLMNIRMHWHQTHPRDSIWTRHNTQKVVVLKQSGQLKGQNFDRADVQRD